MTTDLLRVSASEAIDAVALRVIHRPGALLYDHIVVERQGQICGVVSVRDILYHVTNVRLTQAKYANPLTGLPSAVLVEQEVQALLSSEPGICFFHVDINHFKDFNGRCGSVQGDELILTLAETLRVVGELLPTDVLFTGHIGGDDFVLVSRPSSADATARAVLACFQERWESGFGAAAEAEVSISIAGLRCRPRQLSYREISRQVFAYKKQAKEQGKSTIVLDGEVLGRPIEPQLLGACPVG